MINIDTTGVDVSEEAVKQAMNWLYDIADLPQEHKPALHQNGVPVSFSTDITKLLAALYNEVERLRKELEERG